MTGASMFLTAAAAPSDKGEAAVLFSSMREMFGEHGAREELVAAYESHRSTYAQQRLSNFLNERAAPTPVAGRPAQKIGTGL